MRLDEFLGILARERRERTGDDEGQAGQFI
jgi:hypothetical protein